ncbi:hypothetical protein [Labrys miyagiensis]
MKLRWTRNALFGPARLDDFLAPQSRRIVVGAYELRHEIMSDTSFGPRIWHAREDR